QGRGEVQAIGRKIQRRTRQGRTLSQQPVVQGPGGDGGVATRGRADAGAVGLEVRPARRARIRVVRSALSDSRCRYRRSSYRRRYWQEPVRKTRIEGTQGIGVLGQRLQAVFRESSAAQTARFSRSEDAYPVVQGTGGNDAGARRIAAGDGVFRSLLSASAKSGGWYGKSIIQPVHPENARGTVAPYHLQSRLPGVRGDHQQQILDRIACRYSRSTGEGNDRGHRVRAGHRQGRKRRCACGGKGIGKDRDLRAIRRRTQGLEGGIASRAGQIRESRRIARRSRSFPM